MWLVWWSVCQTHLWKTRIHTYLSKEEKTKAVESRQDKRKYVVWSRKWILWLECTTFQFILSNRYTTLLIIINRLFTFITPSFYTSFRFSCDVFVNARRDGDGARNKAFRKIVNIINFQNIIHIYIPCMYSLTNALNQQKSSKLYFTNAQPT